MKLGGIGLARSSSAGPRSTAKRCVGLIALCISSTASAGGLLLPGAGAISTSRAGASVASAEDGEALSLNPSGMARGRGTRVQIGAAIINYFMTFQRNGTYDALDNDAQPYEGQAYPVVEQDAQPQLGIGRYQPVPVIAVVTDLGGKVSGLNIGAGLYAPNSYPFRRMNNVNGKPYFIKDDDGNWQFPIAGDPPPSTRYDILEQDAAVVLPGIGAAYRVNDNLDVGGRFSAGFAKVKSTIALWGMPANLQEWIKQDSLFTLDAKDNFVTTWDLGVTYRATPNMEFGANYTSQMNVSAKGDAHAVNGPDVTLAGQPVVIQPSGSPRCAPGGTEQALKGCVEFALPMTAQVGGRYKILDADGKERGDLELDLNWEHWQAERASDFRVVVDAQASTAGATMSGIDLKDNVVKHGFRDTWGLRIGGSYKIDAGSNTVVARGGFAYDTAAAKEGWERADIDGASRMMLSAGGSYRLPSFQIDAGFGAILEGTRSSSRNCNPVQNPPPMTPLYTGCGPNGEQQTVDNRQGPDPINPLVLPESQLENPTNQGTYKSHYLMFMLGVSTWF